MSNTSLRVKQTSLAIIGACFIVSSHAQAVTLPSLANAPLCTSSFTSTSHCVVERAKVLATRQQADGSQISDFTVGDTPVHVLVPPASFNPANASEAERERFGIPPPPKPTDTAAMAFYTKMINNWHFADAPAQIVSTPQANVGNQYDSHAYASRNWSGVVAQGGPFYDATTTFQQPSDNGSSSGAQVSTWAGLGGYFHPDNLVQNGTSAFHDSSSVNFAGWFEIVSPSQTSFCFNSGGSCSHASTNTTRYVYNSSGQPAFQATPGGWVEAVTWADGPNDVEFYWYDAVTGKALTVHASWSTFDLSSAEAIAERPAVTQNSQTTLAPMLNFGTIQMSLTANHQPYWNSPWVSVWAVGPGASFNGTLGRDWYQIANPWGMNGSNEYFHNAYVSPGNP